MPRRISDYPDAFAGWNLISSFGSIVSVVATWLFLHLVYLQLVEGKASTRYPWLTPQFYTDTLQTLLNRSYSSLEWALNSPPKPHAFVSLPIQSDFFGTVSLADCFNIFCQIKDDMGLVNELLDSLRSARLPSADTVRDFNIIYVEFCNCNSVELETTTLEQARQYKTQLYMQKSEILSKWGVLINDTFASRRG
jgi:hypothetical protein